jgi:hypothetical protein
MNKPEAADRFSATRAYERLHEVWALLDGPPANEPRLHGCGAPSSALTQRDFSISLAILTNHFLTRNPTLR